MKTLAAVCLLLLTAAPARPGSDLEPIEALIQQGRYAQAEQALRSLLAPSGKADYLLGFTLIQLYRFDEAEKSLRRSVEDQPTSIDRLHALAKSLLEQSKNLAAIEVLDRALAVESRPDLYFARAMCALNAGRDREAEKNLESSLSGQARNPEALYKLGKLKLDRGDYASAREHFVASLEDDPKHLEALFYLGVTELRLENAESSIQAFEQVLAVVPGHVGALYNLVRALQQMGRRDDARATLERFRQMSATQDEVDFLQQAVKKNPANIAGRVSLARKLLEVGKAETALEQALVARQLDPRRAVTYRLLAEAFGQLGRHSDAQQAEDFARRLEAGS
ncbi:MAG: tetratricopeptide repeat protein [Acidobacteriota bacterium]|nr:tetratricopeptide repeat protein [Acidobacteriota bacterium]